MLPQVTLEGALVDDPLLAYSQAGKPWVKMRLAAKDVKRDSSGKMTDGDATFIDVIAFGALAEHTSGSVRKGDSVIVSGRLAQREYETKAGEKRSAYQITADMVGVSLRWKAAAPMTHQQEERPAGDAPIDPPW